MQTPAPNCHRCGFSLEVAKQLYGDFLVALEPLLSFADFPAEEKAAVELAIFEWETHFPQLRLTVFLGPSAEGPSLDAFGFWLINQGVLGDETDPWDNRQTILLLVDPGLKTACVTLGYAAEEWVGQATAQAALEAGAAEFSQQNWRAGICIFLAELHAALTSRSAAPAEPSPVAA